MVIAVEGLATPIGPAGDAVYAPMRIAGGRVRGIGGEKSIVGGTDFAIMYADEKLVHNGNLVVADPAGDILVWYDGFSQAGEGAYDDLLEGRLPANIPCRVAIRTVSTNPAWLFLNRRPLLGIGSFDGNAGTLKLTILSVIEPAARR